MNGLSAAGLACFLILAGAASACASGQSSKTNSAEPLAKFQGVVPTEANPITGEKRLARMRRDGKLPDTFVRGRCTYDLGGDTGSAYYVKACH